MTNSANAESRPTHRERKTTATIKLTPEQRSQIREASGKDVSEVAHAGWLFSADGQKLWLLKSAAPPSRSPARRRRKPRIDSRFTNVKLKIGKSPIHRWGVFASEPIPAGRDVIEYVGEVIDPQECFRRLHHARETYVIEIDSARAIDGAVRGSGAEFINHSCHPNIRYRIERDRVFCQSLRAIDPGEELTANYRFRAESPNMPCRCASPQCRGTINA